MPYLQHLALGLDHWGVVDKISLSCTVCDKKMSVFVEFTKSFLKTFNATKVMYMPFGDNPS